MGFKFLETQIPDVIEIEHQNFGDPRGFFAETFREREFAQAGMKLPFVQDNHSRSTKGVLRGLHYQLLPHAQGKLVRCARGSIFDVAIDLRRKSPHYKKWVARELSETNRRMLYLPPGFAHGFYTFSETADVVYKQTDYYSPENERGIRWNDLDLAVGWPFSGAPLLSAKDAAYPFFKDAEYNF